MILSTGQLMFTPTDREREHDWLNLVHEFEASSVNQTEFCKAGELNPKYFSLKRSRLLPSDKGNGFIKIERKPAV